ncbi:MAG: hypothetical protein U9R39_07845 [Campylobacterota bacterium]|nr:hypothetical protein [Campylobacterota bacterium]
MDKLKEQIKSVFEKQLELVNFGSTNITKDILELKLNTLISNVVEKINIKEQISVPISKTTNDNIYSENFDIDRGRSSDTSLSDNSYMNKAIIKKDVDTNTTIPSNFTLTYEMKFFAKSKFIQNVEDVFEDFKLYYQSKGTLNNDWEAVWKRWVLNQNKYKTHLVKTVIDEDMVLNSPMLKVGQKYIDKNNIELEFMKFKNHYIASGDIKVSWAKMWENWCIKHKEFKPKENTKAKEKADYRWDFRKAKEVSDRIKDWLEFDKKINWLDDFYWKDIPIPGIGWQKVIHPDFNKEEILLYKIDSEDGNFMVEHKTDDIIDAEVLEND